MKFPLQVLGAVARNRSLAGLMLAYAVFSATQYAVWIAMLVYAFDRGGAATAGAVAIAQLVPAALLAPVAATLADRRSPAGVLVGGYCVQVVGMLTAAVAIGLDTPLAAYAGAVVASAAVATTRPAQTVVVPGLVHKAEELTAANALTGWIESMSVVAASAATGVLLAVAGPGMVFVVAGVAGLLSVLLAATVRGMGRSPSTAAPAAWTEPSRAFGCSFASPRPACWSPFSAPSGWLSARWTSSLSYSRCRCSTAAKTWVGYLNVAYGVGGVLAGLAGMALVGRRRLVPPILGSVILIGVALALSAFSTAAGATVVLLAVVGGGRALFNLASRTLLQRAVPAEVVGRVFGVAESIAMTGLAVGSALVPLLVVGSGTVAAVFGTAAILPLVTLVSGRRLFALDAAAHVPIVEIALLRSLRIFRALPAPALEGLARSVERVELAVGDILIRQGQRGDCFYAIADGQLEVTIGGVPVATKVRGDGVAEIALLYDVPRTATVRAASPTTVFALARATFWQQSPATRPPRGLPSLLPMSGLPTTAADNRRGLRGPPTDPRRNAGLAVPEPDRRVRRAPTGPSAPAAAKATKETQDQGGPAAESLRDCIHGQHTRRLQFHFDPASYLEMIRAEVPSYDELQDAVAEATAGIHAERVLELGVGTGQTSRRVLDLHPKAKLVGIDESAEMLAAATAEAAGADLRVGRLQDSRPEGDFDLVVSALAVHHLDGAGKADLFARVADRLRPGGRFVLGDVVVPDDPADAVTPIDGVYDQPSTVDDQVWWLAAAGLHAEVVWARQDLAVIIADSPS